MLKFTFKFISSLDSRSSVMSMSTCSTKDFVLSLAYSVLSTFLLALVSLVSLVSFEMVPISHKKETLCMDSHVTFVIQKQKPS